MVILPRIGPVSMVEHLRFAGSIPGGYCQPDSRGVVRLHLRGGRAGTAIGEGGTHHRR